MPIHLDPLQFVPLTIKPNKGRKACLLREEMSSKSPNSPDKHRCADLQVHDVLLGDGETASDPGAAAAERAAAPSAAAGDVAGAAVAQRTRRAAAVTASHLGEADAAGLNAPAAAAMPSLAAGRQEVDPAAQVAPPGGAHSQPEAEQARCAL